MNRKITFLVITLIAVCSTTVSAKIKLASIFSDHMVLQQQAKNKIWGRGNANKTISLSVPWNNKKYSTKSDSEGRFVIEFETPVAGGPYTIEVSDGEKLTLNDVLVGEVWLCSGQSNMEMPLKGFRGQPVEGSNNKIVAASANQDLRLFTVKRASSTTVNDDMEGSWLQNSPASARDFSATAYYFGDLLQKTLNVPVGLIHSSWSASKIEAWMSKDNLSQFSDVDLSVLQNEKFEYPAGTPTLLYNAMIYPLLGFRINGVIWYQGESNSSNPEQYKRLFASWINQWRNDFENPNLPVYYTQIAPFQSSDKDGVNLPLFREAQLESMSEIENVGMAFTTDLGHEFFIHPPHKQQVGERLAYWALSDTYNIEGISHLGPVYKTNRRLENKNEVEITFEYAEEGLTPENAEIIGFELAGADKIFKPAKASIINGSARVKVWNEEIENPVEVRYCFKNYTEGSLYNNFGLPAASFRAEVK